MSLLPFLVVEREASSLMLGLGLGLGLDLSLGLGNQQPLCEHTYRVLGIVLPETESSKGSNVGRFLWSAAVSRCQEASGH